MGYARRPEGQKQDFEAYEALWKSYGQKTEDHKLCRDMVLDHKKNTKPYTFDALEGEWILVLRDPHIKEYIQRSSISEKDKHILLRSKWLLHTFSVNLGGYRLHCKETPGNIGKGIAGIVVPKQRFMEQGFQPQVSFKL